jgi:hypothetical protein
MKRAKRRLKAEAILDEDQFLTKSIIYRQLRLALAVCWRPAWAISVRRSAAAVARSRADNFFFHLRKTERHEAQANFPLN